MVVVLPAIAIIKLVGGRIVGYILILGVPCPGRVAVEVSFFEGEQDSGVIGCGLCPSTGP